MIIKCIAREVISRTISNEYYPQQCLVYIKIVLIGMDPVFISTTPTKTTTSIVMSSCIIICTQFCAPS